MNYEELVNEVTNKQLEEFIGTSIEKYIEMFLTKNYLTLIETFYGFGNQFKYSPELNVELLFRIDHSKLQFIKIDSLDDNVLKKIHKEINKQGFKTETHHYEYYKKYRKFIFFNKKIKTIGHCIRIISLKLED